MTEEKAKYSSDTVIEWSCVLAADSRIEKEFKLADSIELEGKTDKEIEAELAAFVQNEMDFTTSGLVGAGPWIKTWSVKSTN